jgi:hypothetical protein
MNGSTTFEQNAELTRFLTAYPNLHLGLLQSCPIDASGTGAAEISDASYIRQPTPAANWTVASGQMMLVVPALFPLLITTQSIVGIAFYDAAIGGNLLKVFCDGIAQTYIAGSQPQYQSGDIVITKNGIC